MTGKVFLITGTSSGLGEALVKFVLERGERVIATARDASALSFSGTSESNYLALSLDVTDPSSIETAFQTGIKKFGSIDVVVNNAGYGLAGPFESYTEAQIRQQMEVNFFGVVNVTRKALEVMRDLKTGGIIQQITSVAGQRGTIGLSIYCASKWAVEGFTEALSLEVKPEWNIKFQIVEPGSFRTDWAGRSMEFGTLHAAYDHLDVRGTMSKKNGNQIGDPKKGVQAIYELATMSDPPLRCAIGSDSFKAINLKLDKYKENLEKYQGLSLSTDIDY